ncbi:MAG: penicillin-binding transpeptidase domain-containing protein [Sporichthyaceae bacterium]
MTHKLTAGTRTRHALAVLAATMLATGCSSLPDGLPGGGGGPSRTDQARAVGEAFLADWSADELEAAGARTTDTTAATEALTAMSEALRPEVRTLTARDLSGCEGETPCTLDFDVELELDALGSWSYASALTLVQVVPAPDAEPEWKVSWAPQILHPRLAPGLAFSRTRELPERAPILDRNGNALVSQQTVYRVGVVAGQVPDGAIENLAELTDVNVDGLLIRTNKAEENQFVEAVVLRQSDYDEVKAQIQQIPGALVREDTLTLAPTRQFARGVLGAVGNATAETLAKAGPTASDADSLGLFGLQGIYQQQLAGVPGGRVEIIDASTRASIETLTEFTQAPGTALRVSLDRDIQSAAERAVALTEESSSLVAIDTNTGDILAVANGPADKAGEDRALNGQYAPGSTFKIVSSLALFRAGLTADEQVGCPRTVNVEGKQFENYDGLGDLGRIPFRTAFTQSCNTVFTRKADDLDPSALAEAGDSFGIGLDYDLPLASFSGDIPICSSEVDCAAAGIGQGRVLMSPLSLASIAATVASGTPRLPRLILDEAVPAPAASSASPSPVSTATPFTTATPSAIASPAPGATESAAADEEFVLPPLAEAATLRELMIATVETGTARILDLPGVTVGAKTGTAEYGSETEPGKHAWIVGFMGEVAFAVIVERGDTGSRTAGPLARAFLEAIR